MRDYHSVLYQNYCNHILDKMKNDFYLIILEKKNFQLVVTEK